MLSHTIKNIVKTTSLAGLLVFTSSAFADSEPESFYVWADVTNVTPIIASHYERVPVTNCSVISDNRKQRHHKKKNRRQENVLPALFGGLIGGVIGNQFGSGNGKRAMTMVGAIAGASIASSHRQDDYRPAKHRKVCDTSYEFEEVEVIEGYEVTYRYLGREFERTSQVHPGERLKLYVTVDPYIGDNMKLERVAHRSEATSYRTTSTQGVDKNGNLI